MKHLSICLLFMLLLMEGCSCGQSGNTVASAGGRSLFTAGDSTAYVGFVNRFDFMQTEEFYVELYPLSDTAFSLFERLPKMSDSVIYSDDEYRRQRIPDSLAGPLIDFSGLETLALYDSSHALLGTARYIRTEYLDQNIQSGFIAVYKAEKPGMEVKAAYCTGNLKDTPDVTAGSALEDTALTRAIAAKMGYPAGDGLKGFHYRRSDGRTLSLVNYDTAVVVLEVDGDRLITRYTSKEDEHLQDALFIPVMHNGYPLILVWCSAPESDMEWTGLLVFDGTTYVEAKRQRLMPSMRTPFHPHE